MSRRSARRYWLEWLLLVLALLLLGALIAHWISRERDHIEFVEGDRLQVQARVIDENLQRQIESVNYGLAGIRDELLQGNGAAMRRMPPRRLEVLSDVMPGVRTLLIADAQGTVLDSNRVELIGRNFRQREYFAAPRQRPDAHVLYVSAPFRTTFGVTAINLTRAVLRPDGEFAGIVSATLDPEYFDVLLRSGLYAPDMWTALAHADGIAFLFSPPNAQAVGKNLAQSGSFFTRHRDSGQGATLLSGRAYATGGDRLMAQRTANWPGLRMDKHLIIAVSRDLAALYAPWHAQLRTYAALYGLTALLTILAIYFIQRRRRGADRAAEQQEKTDQLLRYFFNLPFVGIAITAPDSRRWLQVNDLLCETLGYSRAELARMTWAELTHPDDLGKDVAEFERLLRGESDGYTMDKRFLRKDGAAVLTRLSVKSTRDERGAPEYIIATVQDISESKRREEEYRTVIQASTDGFWITDTSGRILDANDSICRMLGYTREEILRLSIPDIEATESPQEVQAHTRELMRAGGAQFQAQHRRKDGTVIDVEVSIQYVEQLGPRLFAFVRDISERKRAEAERVQLEAQLRESQRLEALGTLAGGVAHDFNNIVAAMLGNVELAQRDVGTEHPATESLEEIRKASLRAKSLVQQILAFGRRQLMQRRVIALAPVVREAARLLRSTLPPGVRLIEDCAPDAPPVLADPIHIQQMLLNLGANASQAMQGQERPAAIEIGLSLHVASMQPYSGPERRSGIGRVALRPGRYACLSVRDSGPGLDQATRARMFEPFFTTKPVGMGTGLGLSVVHGIAQEHGASIAVQTAPGEGATFRIYFPAAEEALGRSAAAQPEPPAQDNAAPLPPGEGKSILYVDDDEALVFLMLRLLQREGYRVSGYTDARKALEAVRSQPQAFDLVVTDYNMPGMSGMELTRALRQIRADLPVALASGFISEELRAEAPAAGVSELVYKPNTVSELCGTVARLARNLRA